MERATSRTLRLAGLAVTIIGAPLAFVVPHYLLDSGIPQASVYFTIVLAVVGGILGFIGEVGALILIQMASLNQWLWFIVLLLLSGIVLLIYTFAGPTKPAASPDAWGGSWG
jgi:hypothetical protein